MSAPDKAGARSGAGLIGRQAALRLFARPPLFQPIGSERAGECAALHSESFAFPWAEPDFEALLAAPEIVADGAIEADERLCGMILSRVGADEAEILTVAVSPERRGSGVARTLLAAHAPRLAARGVTRMFLEVDADNGAARALYAASGFRQVAERKAYYRKKDAAPASALVMRRDLPG